MFDLQLLAVSSLIKEFGICMSRREKSKKQSNSF